MKFYHYPKCSTCRKAEKFLQAADVDYTAINIADKTPTKAELKKMLACYDDDIRKLFNTSGMQYRELRMKDKLPTMSAAEAIDLLAANGMLIKRPFIISNDQGLVGFKEDQWQALKA